MSLSLPSFINRFKIGHCMHRPALLLRCMHGTTRRPTSISNPIAATFMRGGTSKGVFLNRVHLPKDESQWSSIFLGIMGSPDPVYGRQLNGMGGGISSLSKICVVGEPTPPQRQDGIDVVYTFIQVGIRDSTLDTTGNCGNLSSMIGVFALDEGLCKARVLSSSTTDHVLATVTSFNTNTSKLVSTTFPVSPPGPGGKNAVPLLDLPEVAIAGVPDLASRITMKFLSPSGSRTGALLPTNRPIDLVTIPELPHPVRVSLVDATNPTVFVPSSDLGLTEAELSVPSARIYTTLEILRRKGAELMGLDPLAQAQPKIAVLSVPDASSISAHGVDVVVHALSMGVLHKAVPLTVGLCLGVAANVQGSLPWEIVQHSRKRSADSTVRDKKWVRMQHPSGLVEVGADFTSDGTGAIDSATVVRTGRRLMKGFVWW